MSPLILHLQTSNPKLLQDVLNAVNALTDEATLQFNSAGVKIAVMDPSRVAMIDATLPSTDFDTYTYTCSEPRKIGVNITELLTYLKRADKNETATLTITPENQLNIAITGHYNRNFNTPILTPSTEECPEPKVDYAVKAKTETAGLHRFFEDVQLVSDHVTIKTENEKLTLTAKEDAKTAEITLDTNHGLLSLEAEAKQVSKAIYSLSYLSEIVKAAKPLSDLVTLEYASDMPVKIDFLPVSNSTAKLTFYLAPRIE